MERGTLYQLRNLINRRNVSTKPKADVNAAEDFLEIVVIGYVISAAMSYLNMSSLDDTPDAAIVPELIWMELRSSLLQKISLHIVDEYIDLETIFKVLPDVPKGRDLPDIPKGTVYDYTCEVLSLGLLYMNFKDSVREGDGDRVIAIWKYLMLIFKAMGHRNYAAEAFTLLSQYHLTLPPNLAEQLKWSRFVNVHGLPGHNISCDLHQEHMNRLVKVAIEGLGANKKSSKAVIRVGKAVGLLATITQSFDREVGVTTPSGRHSDSSMEKDLAKIVKQLLQQDLFNPTTTKTHRTFTNLKKNVIKKLEEKKTKKWMFERFTTL